MVQEFLKSLFLIFMAEMGDKTQILALAFATQFSIKEVLTGVFLGCLLNHGIAVLLGSYLSSIIPLNIIQIIAGFSFVVFALWTLKDDEESEEEDLRKKYGPILTVATAFFIGELGDKTQLTAITLSVDAVFPIFVLMGTVTGMVLTSGVGIFIGSRIGKNIPEIAIRIVSSSIFLFFGIVKLYETLPKRYLNILNISTFVVLIGISIFILIRSMIKNRKKEKITVLKEVALTLYEYHHQIRESIENICLGDDNCGKCNEMNCMIDYTKRILDESLKDENYMPEEQYNDFSDSIKKDFDENKVIESLSMIVSFLIKDKKHEKSNVINNIRRMLERILFNVEFEFNSEKEYFKLLKDSDESIAIKIINRVKEFN